MARLYSDKEILNLLNKMDPASRNKGFVYMYENYYYMVKDFIMDNNGQEADVEDYFQEAIIVFYNKVCVQKEELRSSISTYIFAVVRNQWFKKFRNNREFVSHSDMQVNNLSDDSIDELFEVSDKANVIAELLENLGGSCKSLLIFFYYEKIRLRDIAEFLNLQSEQSAKNKKAICMKKLKALVLNSKEYLNLLNR